MKNGMKCYRCGGIAKFRKGIRFGRYKIDGWECKCGEAYFDPVQAERILFINKLKKHKFHLKLSQVRSNLVLRIPKGVSDVLNLHKGEEVEFGLEDDNKIVIKTKAG
jgi:hypothetical protein